ncbi:hypothetical protein DRO33_06515 [Candidatus Bathyarchaeota archaeon]|nr:MAG: hypothetical protein DRO33_06515 [Candidatus Bathyarchaeota archaeon]
MEARKLVALSLLGGCATAPSWEYKVSHYIVRPVPKAEAINRETYTIAWGPQDTSLRVVVKNTGDTVISLDLENSVVLSEDSTVSPWPGTRQRLVWFLQSTQGYSSAIALASSVANPPYGVSSGGAISSYSKSSFGASVEAQPWVKVKIPPQAKWVASPLGYASWKCGKDELEKLKAFWKGRVLNGITLKIGESYENFWVRADSLYAKPVLKARKVAKVDKTTTIVMWSTIGGMALLVFLLNLNK